MKFSIDLFNSNEQNYASATTNCIAVCLLKWSQLRLSISITEIASSFVQFFLRRGLQMLLTFAAAL